MAQLSLVSQLRELNEAKNEGSISEEEFTETKARILTALTAGHNDTAGKRMKERMNE